MSGRLKSLSRDLNAVSERFFLSKFQLLSCSKELVPVDYFHYWARYLDAKYNLVNHSFALSQQFSISVTS